MALLADACPTGGRRALPGQNQRSCVARQTAAGLARPQASPLGRSTWCLSCLQAPPRQNLLEPAPALPSTHHPQHAAVLCSLCIPCLDTLGAPRLPLPLQCLLPSPRRWPLLPPVQMQSHQLQQLLQLGPETGPRTQTAYWWESREALRRNSGMVENIGTRGGRSLTTFISSALRMPCPWLPLLGASQPLHIVQTKLSPSLGCEELGISLGLTAPDSRMCLLRGGIAWDALLSHASVLLGSGSFRCCSLPSLPS